MRRQFVTVAAAGSLLLLGCLLPPILLLVRSNAEATSLTSAHVLAQAVTMSLPTQTTDSLEQLAGPDYRITVFRPDRTVLGAPATRTSDVDRAQTGEFRTIDTGSDIAVLVPAPTAAGTAVIQVVATEQALHRGVAARSWRICGLAAALALVAVGLAAWTGGRASRSARRLAATAERLAAGDLTARAVASGPADLRRVGERLGVLAVRIEQTLDRQRRDAADISHRLRTPLAALRLDMDRLRGTDGGRGDVPDAMLDLLEHHVSSLTRAVDDIIRSTRWGEPAARGIDDGPCDLVAVVRDRLRLWSVLAEGQDRALDTILPSRPLPVAAPRADLESALDALIGNVFAHTPAGVALTVAARRGPHGPELVVEDSGPGFPDAGVVRRGRSGAGSTGLGLDIAGRVAASTGGERLVGRSATGGARVTLRFGVPRGGHHSAPQRR